MTTPLPFSPSTSEALRDAGEAVGRSGPESLILWVGIVGGLVILLGAVILSMIAQRDRRAHGATFRRLSRVLGLSHGDRRWLARIARYAGIACPAAVLISRGTFDYAVSRAPRSTRQPARHIRQKVFE